MLSTTEIANVALSHLGIGKEIDDVTERSQEAAAFRRYFKLALSTVLRDFAWPFATKYVALGLVTEFVATDKSEYRFAYRKPADALTIRKIGSGIRRDTADTMVPFTESFDNDGVLILTDLREARVEYTAYTEATSIYPDDFTMALTYKLASLIAPRLSAGDPFKRGDACQGQYFFELSKARANALNEMQVGENLESEFIRAREG